MTYLHPRRPCVLIEDSRAGMPGAGAWHFTDPLRIVTTDAPAAIADCLAALDEAVAAGFWVAGWLSYEAGHAFETRLARAAPRLPAHPLLWFGVFRDRVWRDGAAMEARWTAPAPTPKPHVLTPARAALDAQAYRVALARIQDYIAAGDVYQVN
ncbi:MAG: aminodeoxychorismate synthase, component I, partial [Alphaproteobacteria bacterium]